MSFATPTPFTIHVSDERLARLRRKLEDYELPDTDIVEDAGWDYGISLEWVKGLRKYWLEEFDWRKAEQRMNKWNHFKVLIEDVSLHFIHQKSSHPSAIPLIIVHGWPGVFCEFENIIEPLTNPPEGHQAFHVVIPSVPSFGFSSTPRKRGWGVKDNARIFNVLMTDILGYQSFAAQGGDWGSIMATILSDYPKCKAIHLNMCVAPPPFPYAFAGLFFVLPAWLQSRLSSWLYTPEERKQFSRTKDFALGAGYFGVQASQPFTIGLALNDSPMGLLCWIGEKYHTHVDPSFDLLPDVLLTVISIFYFTQTFASSCLPYHENNDMFAAPPARVTSSLLGVSTFASDILIMPESWVKKHHRGAVKFYKAHEKGGHFPSIDNPEGLVSDLREYLGQNQHVFVEED